MPTAHRARQASWLAACGAAALLVAGCSSSSSSSPPVPKVAAAKTFHLTGFAPSHLVRPGRPFTISFAIAQPSGRTLVDYRRGAGPHTGVHLIVVREDLSVLVHRHPQVAADGRIRQPLVLPTPGPYRVLVDAYPNLSGPQRNFQLFETIRAAGSYRPRPIRPFRPTATVGGYRVTLSGASRVRAVTPASVTATVTDPQGRPVRFKPWYGALAHAIFFRAGSLDYFHTHVCGPSTPGCTSTLGGASVTGRPLAPGKLQLGILLPVAGTWRLFLQFQSQGRIVTAPFTLRVR